MRGHESYERRRHLLRRVKFTLKTSQMADKEVGGIKAATRKRTAAEKVGNMKREKEEMETDEMAFFL